MKKSFRFAAILFSLAMLQSCYVYTTQVGNGGSGGTTVKKMNHYLLYGLAPVGVSDAKAMAGGATDYTITIKHSFVDGLLQGLTFGLYTPTTTIVTK